MDLHRRDRRYTRRALSSSAGHPYIAHETAANRICVRNLRWSPSIGAAGPSGPRIRARLQPATGGALMIAEPNSSRSAKMQFILTGFTQELGFRVFAFERLG